MTGTLETSMLEGMLITTTYDDTPFGVRNMFNWGISVNQNWEHDLDVSQGINQVDKQDQFYYDLEAGNHPLDKYSAQFNLVNGLPFWAFYGKVSHTVEDTTQTIVNKTTSETKPFIHVLRNMGGLMHEAYGIQIHDLSWNWETGSFVQCNLLGKGRRHNRRTSSYAITSIDYPSNVSTPFTYCAALTWNSETLYARKINCAATQSNVVTAMNKSGYYDSISDTGKLGTIFTINCTSTHTAVWQDYWTPTARTFVVQMKKDNGDYFTYTCANARLRKCQHVGQIGTVHEWILIIWCEAVSIECQDHVDDDYYGGSW